jgi:integrase
MQAAKYFLENHAKINCTPSSFKTYESILKSNLLPFFAKKKLVNITLQDIPNFIDTNQNENMTNKRLSNCVTLLGNMLKKFKDWEFIQDSPYNGIINVQYSKKQKILTLQKYQTEILLKRAKYKYPELYSLILLALSIGFKKAEIRALKKEDIDFENRKISINKTLCENSNFECFCIRIIRNTQYYKKL